MSLRLSQYGNRVLRTANLLPSLTQFTQVAFVKINARPAAGDFAYIITTNSASINAVYLDASGFVRGNADNNAADTGQIGAALATAGATGANWYMIAWRANGTGAGAMTVSVSTVSAASITSASMAWSNASTTPTQMSIGSVQPDGAFGSRTFDGYIAYLKQWPSVLTDAQLIAEASSGGPVTSGSTYFWDFQSANASAAITPAVGTGAWVAQEVAPGVSTDNPVFAVSLSGSDTLPTFDGPVWAPVPQQTVYIGLPWQYAAPPMLSGLTPITYTKLSGPDWISVSPADGTPSGTPSGVPTLTSVTIRATNSVDYDDLTIALDVQRTTPLQPPGPTVATTASPASGAMVRPAVPMVDSDGMIAREWWRMLAQMVSDLRTALNRAPQQLASATLTASAAVVYTAQANSPSIVSALTLTNSTFASVSVSVWIVPANGTPGAGNALLSEFSVAAGASVPVPSAAGQVVSASGSVYAQGAGVVIVLTGSVQA